MNKKIIFSIAAIVLFLLVISGVKFKNFDAMNLFSKGLTLEEAKTKAVDFIGGNLVEAGTEVKVEKIVLKDGLYELDLDVSGQKITAYMTKDGKKFFPSAIDMEEAKNKADKDNVTEKVETKEVSKNDKPAVELFVMSYCPYGTQAEKGILPAVSALGDKIDFKLKFVDYVMHDKKEIDENLRQYCIDKQEPKKLNAYLDCFLKAGEGTEASCMESAKIDAKKVSVCAESADKEFEITKNYEDKSSWSGGRYPMFNVHKKENDAYGVSGSPALVINGVKVESGRDSASFLKTICSAFNEAPKECQTELSSTSPSPGFGAVAAAGSASDASCEN